MKPLTRDRRWWLDPEGEAHGTLFALAVTLAEKSRERHEIDRRNVRLYGGAEYAGITPGTYARVLPRSARVAWNMVARCVDTYVAKQVVSTPAPMFLTSGGDYDNRRKAQKLNKFGKGVLHASGVYRIGPTIERDAAIFGTGIAYGYREGKRLCAERVFPWELLVDDVEAMYGEPRGLIRRKFVDRRVLAEQFPEDSDERRAIEEAPEADKDAIGRDTTADQIEVLAAWRLPSSDDASDGRYVLTIANSTLRDEKWKRTRFPFAVRRYSDPVAGFWGIGITDRIFGIQLEINKLLLRIQEAHHLLGRPLVILDEVSGIPETHITNEVATILVNKAPNAGEGLRIHAPPTMPPDVYQHLLTLRAEAYAEIGTSEMEASAKKPAGLNSAPSLREYNDIGSERFALQGKRREEWYLDCVRLFLDEVREMRSFDVDVPDKRSATRVSWKDVDLRDEAYVLKCFPTSLLPQTPAGQMEAVQELIASGLVPQDAAVELLDMPDLDEWRELTIAPRTNVRKIIDAILDGGTAPTPEPFHDLQYAVTLGKQVYNLEQAHGCPEERLEELRRFTTEAARLLDQAAQAPAAAPAPIGVASVQAPTMPAPVTDALAMMPPQGTA